MSSTLPPSHPFDFGAVDPDGDGDTLHEECGVFGVVGVADAANFVALGLHALQHRGQEAGGIVTYDPEHGFNSARKFGYVRDNFTSQSLMETLPGALGIGHVRYSTSGSKGRGSTRLYEGAQRWSRDYTVALVTGPQAATGDARPGAYKEGRPQ